MQYTFLRAYGATESLPPEDADIIVDNAATGSTLKANNLEVFDTLMNSTTRMFASKAAWENPAKRERIEKLALLLTAVLNARKRLMVTFNCPADKLAHMLDIIPACVPPPPCPCRAPPCRAPTPPHTRPRTHTISAD